MTSGAPAAPDIVRPTAEPPGWLTGSLFGDISAVASVLSFGATLVVAPSAAAMVGASVLTFLGTVWAFRRKIRRLSRELIELSTHLQEIPNYTYRLNEATFVIDPVNSVYKIDQHKIILNRGSSPMEFLLGHFTCNTRPEDAQQSREYYRDHPVRWEDLQMYAFDTAGDLDIELRNDYNNRKEYLIHFRHNNVPRPVGAQGERDLHYGYTIPFALWGTYFDKPIDRPTELLRVHIKAPRSLQLRVGVTQLLPSNQRRALDLNPEESEEGEWKQHSFTVQHPEVGSAYQFTWAYPGLSVTPVTTTPPPEAAIAAQQ